MVLIVWMLGSAAALTREKGQLENEEVVRNQQMEGGWGAGTSEGVQ